MKEQSSAMDKKYQYTGFISYSQKDRKWARKVHKALEFYRLPSRLGGEKLKQRKLGRFFRDEDELASAASLDGALTDAIDSSHVLIVICSPNAVASKWVNEEIKRFKSRGALARVLPVIVSGEPDSVAPEEQCFPSAMFHHINPDGTLGDTTGEPLGVDVRKEKFPRIVTRLAAGIMQLDFDALWQRERRRIFRTRLIAAAGTISIGFVTLGLVLYGQRNIERSDRDLFVQASERAMENHDRHAALRFATLAIRQGWASSPSEAARENYRQVSKRLPEILRVDHSYSPHQTVNFAPDKKRFPVSFATLFSEGSKLLTVGYNDIVRTAQACVWDVSTNARMACIDQSDEKDRYFRTVALLNDENRLITEGGGLIRVWDLSSGEVLQQYETEKLGRSIHLSEQEGRLMVVLGQKITVWDINTGDKLSEDSLFTGRSNINFSRDDKYLKIRYSDDNSIQLFDIEKMVLLPPFRHDELVWGGTLFENDARFISWGEDKTARVWNLSDGKEIHRFQHDHPVLDGLVSLNEDRLLTWAEPQTEDSDGFPVSLGHLGAIWDLETGNRLADIDPEGYPGNWLFFNEDKQLLVAASGLATGRNSLQIFNTDTGERSAQVAFGGRIGGAEFFADETRLLTWTGRGDATARIWRVQDGSTLEELQRFRHTGSVTGARLFSENQRLLTTDEVGTIRIWDTHNGAELARMDHLSGTVGAALIGNENRILSWGDDGTARLWDISWNLNGMDLSLHASEICQDRLQGQKGVLEVTGNLVVELRHNIIFERDLAYAPGINQLVGHDVCGVPQQTWQPITRWLAGWLP